MKAVFLALSLFLATEAEADYPKGFDYETGAYTGKPYVVDGDSLHIDGFAFRLQGIDAPELDQKCHRWTTGQYDCGEIAKGFLKSTIGDQPVTCKDSGGGDRYGRSIATCTVNGRDLGKVMVRAGWAIAYTRYSDKYAGEEEEARNDRLGIWQGQFDPPWLWRANRY